MNYSFFRRLRQIVATIGSVIGLVTIVHFVQAQGSLKTPCNELAILFWTVGPPLWFFGEYWGLDRGIIGLPANEDKETCLKSIKDYADYASKIWAAVLAFLILVFEAKKGG